MTDTLKVLKPGQKKNGWVISSNLASWEEAVSVFKTIPQIQESHINIFHEKMLGIISHQEIQLKTTMRYHFIPVRIAMIQRPLLINAGKDS